jgi:aminoglycoside phosphotransferase (APT) family kinase protein
MLRPVSGDAELREVVRVDGGLVNTVYRVKTKRAGAAFGLRVYAAGGPAFEAECRLLESLAATLPVPRVLYADASRRHYCAHPYLVYQWIEGITLNECRRQSSPKALLTLAEPLGRLLARIAAALPAAHVSQTLRAATALERSDGQLRAGLARERLGCVLADQLRDCLKSSSSTLHALDRTGLLVHGDFGGRNILVKVDESGEWRIGGVIDWEDAAAGSALWDVGSLFRYTRRYSEEFRALFARGYRGAGGKLPPRWWLSARTIDATRLVAILSEERELPGVFAECAELIESLVADSGSSESSN